MENLLGQINVKLNKGKEPALKVGSPELKTVRMSPEASPTVLTLQMTSSSCCVLAEWFLCHISSTT